MIGKTYFVFAVLLSAAGAQANEFLRDHMDLLMSQGRMAVSGVELVGVDVLPRLYSRNHFEPVWPDRERIEQLFELADKAYRVGLDPKDYPLDALRELLGAEGASTGGLPQDEHARADLDILASETLVRIAYQLHWGKVNPTDVDPRWNFRRGFLDDHAPAETIRKMIDSGDLIGFADERLPRGLIYRETVKHLARYRELEQSGGWPSVPSGRILNPGDQDARVRSLRRRLVVTGELDERFATGPNVIDENVEAALKRFQIRHKIEPDGALGPASLRALNASVEVRILQLRGTLERLRWVLDDAIHLEDLVLVNIAGQKVAYIRDSEIRWVSKVQVGLPYRTTPIFRGELDYLVVNPTWTIPPGILRRSTIPKLNEMGKAYLQDNDMMLLNREGGPVDLDHVDFGNLTPNTFPYIVRQRPGPENALGLVKFIFPNPYFVFLHDTNHRELFDESGRTFSSGCIRLQNPFELAELVVNKPEWNQQAFADLVDTRQTRTIHLDQPLAVYLIYATAMPTQKGDVEFYDDVYSRDDMLFKAMASAPRIVLPER